MPTPELRAELEAYRVKWELVNHRKVDLTRSYVSMWPTYASEWLLVHDTQRYFDGLPEFVQDYMRGKMELAARSGQLDNMGDRFLQLYLSGGMNKPGLSRD